MVNATYKTVLFICFLSHFSRSQEVWEIVYLVQQETGVNVWNFFQSGGGYGDDAHDKGLKSPKIIADDGNYRNAKLNQWETIVPRKVRMAFHNAEGEILWMMTFNATGTTKQPESWFTSQRLISAEEDTIMESKHDDLFLRFNQSTISVERKNGRKWLSVEWSGVAGPKMAFSSSSARNPSDLSSVSYSTNSERIKTEPYDTYLTTGEEYKICYLGTPRYIFGIGLGKITPTNFIKFISFKTSTSNNCYVDFVPYRSSNCQEEVFRPDYSSGDKQFFPVATTKAKSIGFNYTRLTYGNEIYFFIMSNEFIPVPILTIQWLYDHGELAEEIKKYLVVDKVTTSLYKRHQTSAVDDRGSVVVFGLLGLFLLLAVLLLVILLDAATLGRHLKMMKFNTSHFRNIINLKMKRIKGSFKNKNSKVKNVELESTHSSKTQKSTNQTLNKIVSVDINKQDVSTRIGSNHPCEKSIIKTSDKRPNIAVTASSKQVDKPNPGIVRSSRNPTQKGSRHVMKNPIKP